MANQNFRVKNGINVGAAVTITTDEFQVGDTRIHTSGIEVKSINVSSGVVTATSIVATTGTFSGNVSIGGTLTYEDVTNIDSVGIITARSGVRVNSGGLVVTSGVSTFTNLIVSAGSTSAPSISPTGDSNTGIFFPSPDTIAFAEGGVEALRIDSNANIGIGTTGTGDKLTVLGRLQIQQDSGSNNRLILRGQPGSTYRWNIDNNGSSNDLRIFREDDVTTAGGLVYASISSSGNLTLNNGNLVIGTAGKGIDFSATANSSGTMTSELLSDYEEGTFTITITGTSSGSGNVSGTARYTKIGRLCYVFYRIDNQSFPTFSGQMRISLPFTAYNGATGNETQIGSKIYFYPLANWDGVANCAGFFIQTISNTATAAFGIEIVDGDRQSALTSSNSSLSNSTGNYFSATLMYEVAP